jgi:hypothetical protein
MEGDVDENEYEGKGDGQGEVVVAVGKANDGVFFGLAIGLGL